MRPDDTIYTDGYAVITREEFLDLQYRIHCGDPVAYMHVVLQQRRADLERERLTEQQS